MRYQIELVKMKKEIRATHFWWLKLMRIQIFLFFFCKGQTDWPQNLLYNQKVLCRQVVEVEGIMIIFTHVKKCFIWTFLSIMPRVIFDHFLREKNWRTKSLSCMLEFFKSLIWDEKPPILKNSICILPRGNLKLWARLRGSSFTP